MPSVCSLILIPKMGIVETMKQFLLKEKKIKEMTCSTQKYLLTATLAKYKVERLVQDPFLAFNGLEGKITFH